MSFRATLTLAGKEHDVLNCSFNMSRDTDPKGRPSSGVYGGRITFEVESTSDTSIS
jgi:Hemolysin coregulated protein Hcp (TssD)